MAQISLRIDDDVKRAAELVCKDIGITMSAAINIYLKKMGKEKRIPFELTAEPFCSDTNMSALNESIEQFNQGQTVTETLEKFEKE